MSEAKPLICNSCLKPIGLGLSFTWYHGKPYHSNCGVNPDLITRAQAAADVAAAIARAEKAIAATEAWAEAEINALKHHQRYSLEWRIANQRDEINRLKADLEQNRREFSLGYEAAVAAEREACAQIADAEADTASIVINEAAAGIATAIRARSKK